MIRVSERNEFNVKCDQRVQYMRLEVLMVSWDTVPYYAYDLVDRYQHFEGTCCLHLECLKKKIYTLKMDALGLPQMLVPVPLWRLRQHLHTKYWYLPTKLHGVISQETVILKKFIVSITQIYKTLKRKISNIGYIIGNNLYLMNSFM